MFLQLTYGQVLAWLMQKSLQVKTKTGASPVDGHQVLLNVMSAPCDGNYNNPGNAGLFFLAMNAALPPRSSASVLHTDCERPWHMQ